VTSGVLALDVCEMEGLVAYARTFVGDDGADAVQEALVACWQAEQRGTVITRGYVFAAVKHRCLSLLRARARRPAADLAVVAEPRADGDDVTGGVLAAEMVEWAGDLVERAELTTRQATVLHYVVAGYTHAEIGALLGISADAVGQLLARARARFVRMGVHP
jgi:RNA polymerase sigma factor (sigma-70 family)